MFTKKNVTIELISLLVLLLTVQSCVKDSTVYLDNAAAVTAPVSFSKDIVPILTNKCGISGCHASGGHVPTLTADVAYNALINGNYVDLSNPNTSSVYLWLTGKKSTAMPAGGPSNPSNINNLVLGWIQQGAKNN